VVSAAIRLALAATIGFGQDETYSVAIARRLALSYFDHPPLHLWIVGLWDRFVGREDPWLLRLPFIALFAASSVLLYRLTAQAYGARAGLWALLALNLVPLFTLSIGSAVLPDGPLLCSALLAVWAVTRALAAHSLRAIWGWWLLAGAAAGLALLSKYLAVFPIVGLLLVVLRSGERRTLMHPAPWVAALLALVMFTPVLVWNAAHGWASFAFQGGRALSSGFSFARGATNLAAQAAYLLPWMALALAVALLRSRWRGAGADASDRLFALLAIGPIACFALAGFWIAELPHWPAIGWLFAFPLLGRSLARLEMRHAAALRWCAALSAGLLAVLIALLASQARSGWLDRFVAGFPAQDPTVEVLDWRALRSRLAQRGLLPPDALVATVNWIDAGRVDYALAGRVPVLCLSDDPHQYAFLADVHALAGRDALIIANARRSDWPQRAAPYFQRIEALPPITLLRAGEPVITLALAHGIALLPPPAPARTSKRRE
jgi:4-amino-4-deoxy-L-arabinose transferase-like glycosyltransferase